MRFALRSTGGGGTPDR